MRKNIVYERLDVYKDIDSFLTWRESVFSFYMTGGLLCWA